MLCLMGDFAAACRGQWDSSASKHPSAGQDRPGLAWLMSVSVTRRVTASSNRPAGPSAACSSLRPWGATADTWPTWEDWLLEQMLPTFLKSRLTSGIYRCVDNVYFLHAICSVWLVGFFLGQMWCLWNVPIFLHLQLSIFLDPGPFTLSWVAISVNGTKQTRWGMPCLFLCVENTSFYSTHLS